MTITILLILLGFVLLYYGSEWLVKGAVVIANALGLSREVIGLTLVAFGTSSPELVVNLVAAYDDHTGFALANVSGSNLANLLIGFGLASLFTLTVARQSFRMDFMFLTFTPLLVLLAFLTTPDGALPWFMSFLLLGLFVLYLRTIQKRARDGFIPEEAKMPTWRGAVIFLIGCACLYFGGNFVFESSLHIAEHFRLDDTLVAFFIVALGTSIPDIMASAVASKNGENAIAVGNLLGSNIFNVLLILSATILMSGRSLESDPIIIMDYLAVVISSGLFWVLVALRHKLTPAIGAGLIIIYAGYGVFRYLQ